MSKKALSRLFGRMRDTDVPDAFDVHRLKRFIDEQVTFGKSAEGLGGQTERVMKRLRRGLDQALDKQFPEYDAVNTVYAETIGALDAFQDAVGRKVNLNGPNANKQIGQLSRRLMSNTQSRVNMLDAINDIERTAKKFPDADNLLSGPGQSQDLLTQVLFMDELDSVFGPVARTSFQGQVEQGGKNAARRARGGRDGIFEAAIDAAAEGLEKARGIDQENAYKAIRDLLSKEAN